MMPNCAMRLEFEKAALWRDQVKEINNRLHRKMKAEMVGTKGSVG